jgi:hypothetical protein
MHLQAENIKQSFSASFGPISYSWNDDEGSTENWTYRNLQRASTSSANPEIFYGEGAISLFAYSQFASDGYICSPEKTGGVGWISFWYKVRSVISDLNMLPLQLVVSVSENGVDFTEIETVEISPSDAKNFSYFSKVVNDLNMKKVKIAAKRPSGSYLSFEVNIDEIIITDAVSGGTPAHISAVENSRSLEGEINLTSPCNITVKGSGFDSSILTFAVDKGDASPFVFTSTSVPGASITESGYTLPLNFTPTAKGNLIDFLKVTVDGLSEMVFPLKGAALERTIVEDFNEKGGMYDNSGYTSFEYYSGWQVVNGTTLYIGDDGKGSNASYVLEGARSMRIWTSLTSPRKIGGVGTVSFMYRVFNSSQQIEFFTDISSDGTSWTQVDSKTAIGSTYIPYSKKIDDADAKYVRIRIDQGTYYQGGIIIDQFIITESGKSTANVEAAAQTVTTDQPSLTFSIPLIFTGIQSDISLSIEDPQFVLAKTSLTAAEASGSYSLEVTYTPEAGKNYANAALTISGGGLLFPVKVSISAYSLFPTLFTDFDGAWGAGTLMGDYITDKGWTVSNSYRNTSVENNLYGSPACVYANYGGKLISPPKSGGVGTIHFFAKGSNSSNATLGSLYISDNGSDWTPVEAATNYPFAGGAYGEYEFIVDNPSAMWVKLEISSSGYNSLYIDNFTVTANGKKIPHVTQVNQPMFMIQAGKETSDNIVLHGSNITSDVKVRIKSGAAFSLHDFTTIPAGEINDKDYPLPVYFQSETGTYFSDTLLVSGDDFAFEIPFQLKGYNMQDIIYQDFEGTWLSSLYTNHNINGWEAVNSYRSTYNVINGLAHIEMRSSSSVNEPAGELISIPKSGGVGTVSFLYRIDYNPVKLKISAYKSLSEAPLATVDVDVPANTPISQFESVFNMPEALYVKIQNVTESGWCSVYIDNVIVTAYRKEIPTLSVTESLALIAYPGETANGQVEITVANVEDEVKVSVKNGDNFSIDKTSFMPVNGSASETIGVTYTPSDKAFIADTLIIESKGLAKPYQIALYGYIPQNKIVEDFNIEWAPTGVFGNSAVNGWLLKSGARSSYPYEGIGSVQIRSTVDTKTNGSLTSPPMANGVNTVSFYYRSETTKLYLQTSVDGNVWKNNDSIEVTPSFYAYKPHFAEIKESDAKFFRIESVPTQTFSYWDTHIDSIVVEGYMPVPYLSLVNTVEATQTTVSTPLEIPVKIRGFLNTEALIVQDDNVNYTLSATKIDPADLENNATFTLNVTFTTTAKGSYPNEIRITNGDINPITIPVTVVYEPVGIDKVSGKVQVYMSGDGLLHVCGVAAGTEITVTNMLGQNLFRTKVNATDETFNLPVTGVYIVKAGENVWKIKK